jgi:hypothetical protein
MPGNRLLEIENILSHDDDDDGFLQGVITAETRDAFNLPIYCLSKEEVESAVAKCGAFDMQCVEWSDDSDLFLEHERLRLLQYPHKFATFYSAWVRAMVGPIMEPHMGLQATNGLSFTSAAWSLEPPPFSPTPKANKSTNSSRHFPARGSEAKVVLLDIHPQSILESAPTCLLSLRTPSPFL